MRRGVSGTVVLLLWAAPTWASELTQQEKQAIGDRIAPTAKYTKNVGVEAGSTLFVVKTVSRSIADLPKEQVDYEALITIKGRGLKGIDAEMDDWTFVKQGKKVVVHLRYAIRVAPGTRRGGWFVGDIKLFERQGLGTEVLSEHVRHKVRVTKSKPTEKKLALDAQGYRIYRDLLVERKADLSKKGIFVDLEQGPARLPDLVRRDPRTEIVSDVFDFIKWKRRMFIARRHLEVAADQGGEVAEIAKKHLKEIDQPDAPPPAPVATPAPAPVPPPVKAAPEATPAPKPKQVAKAPPKIAPAAPPPPPKEDPRIDGLLAEAKQLYKGLFYDKVIPITKQILAFEDIDIEKRLDAYLLQGSSLAIVGDPVEAEKPFRFLLRGRPDFDMSPDTPPKILAVFRKVQVEEQTIRAQMKELERQRLIRELVLDGDDPAEASGGDSVEFEYRLTDPRAAVAVMSVQYRKAGQGEFSSLALERDEGGIWRGEIPGGVTENDKGLTLEYFVSTADREGAPLLQNASPQSPNRINISPGSVQDHLPFYETTWFWIAAGGVLAASATASVIAINAATALPDSDLEQINF